MKTILPFLLLLIFNLYLILRNQDKLNEITLIEEIDTDLKPDEVWTFLKELFSPVSKLKNKPGVIDITFPELEEGSTGSISLAPVNKSHPYFLRCSELVENTQLIFVISNSPLLSGSFAISIKYFLKQTTLNLSININYSHLTAWIFHLKYISLKRYINEFVICLSTYESSMENPPQA